AFGQAAPGRAGLGDPQDGVDEQAVVPGGDTRLSCPSGQQVFDALEVFVSDGVPVQHCSLVISTTVHASIIRPSLSNVHTPQASCRPLGLFRESLRIRAPFFGRDPFYLPCPAAESRRGGWEGGAVRVIDEAGGWEYRTEEVAEKAERTGQALISPAVDGLLADAAVDGWELAFA